jgi:hypothetical protein
VQGIDPTVWEIGLEVVKAIIGVVIPAITVALTFSLRRLNQKLQKKSLKDEIYRQISMANEVKTFKAMNMGKKTETLLESMQAFVVSNEIAVSEIELKLMVERALQSENNLQMRFSMLDTRSEE